jgi:hypothetical protein
MKDFKCPFCGSKELKVSRGKGDVVLKGYDKDGPIYEPIEDFCCKAQKQNAKYAKSFSEDSRPSPEDIAKW